MQERRGSILTPPFLGILPHPLSLTLLTCPLGNSAPPNPSLEHLPENLSFFEEINRRTISSGYWPPIFKKSKNTSVGAVEYFWARKDAQIFFPAEKVNHNNRKIIEKKLEKELQKTRQFAKTSNTKNPWQKKVFAFPLLIIPAHDKKWRHKEGFCRRKTKTYFFFAVFMCHNEKCRNRRIWAQIMPSEVDFLGHFWVQSLTNNSLIESPRPLTGPNKSDYTYPRGQ